MARMPFTVRPIDLKDVDAVVSEPVSITDDLSGKMTLSSKHVAVHLAEIIDAAKNKDVTKILLDSGAEEIIVPTNTFLQIARAKDAESTDEKKLWPVPFFIGLIIGLGTMVLLFEEISLLLIAVIALAGICGGLVGFVWQKFYDAQLKKMMQEWAKEMLKDD